MNPKHTNNNYRKSIKDEDKTDKISKENGVPISTRGAAFTSKSRNNHKIKQRMQQNVNRSRKAKRNRRFAAKGRHNRNNKGHNRSTSRGQTFIPEINQKPPLTRCFRYEYENNGPTTFLFNNDDLTNALGFVLNTSTAFYPLIDSYKLLRIGISILPRDSTSGFTMFGVRWQGQFAPDVLDTMIVGNAFPSHRNFYPYEDSTAYFWQDQPSVVQNLFEFNVDADGATIILDLEMEIVLGDGDITGSTLTNPASFTGIASRVMPASGAQSFSPVLLNAVS